jgi:hypothetical protein
MFLLDSLCRCLVRRVIVDRKLGLEALDMMDWAEAMLERELKEDRCGKAPG